MPSWLFTKMTAAGNDFICFDNTGGEFNALIESGKAAGLAKALCRRGLGVGADGLIFASRLDQHPLADIRARFFEPDGSEAELCGNGTACFTQWVLASGLLKGREVRILTDAGMAMGTPNPAEPGRVRVCIPQPFDLQLKVPVEAAGRHWDLATVVTGVPHAVIYVTDLETADVTGWGRAIRFHPLFQPRGINANFVKILGVGHLAVRTFEFGVEAETLACGTGSASAAIITALRENWPRLYWTGDEPVLIDVRGGETLKVWFTCRDGVAVTDVCLETRVRTVYEGRLSPDMIAGLGNA